jgi:hypothetical protein
MKILFRCLIFAFGCSVAFLLPAVEPAAPLKALGRMPVKEITVFKDGHAFVAQEGSLPVDDSGNVLIDQLPNPVIGTFWAYSADKNVPLTGVVASQRRVAVERTALNLRELLEANTGAEAVITETNSNHYPATIIGIPTRSAAELAATSAPDAPERLPESGDIILLKTPEGMKAVNISRIQDVTFKNPGKLTDASEEFRNLLALKLDWGKKARAASADVGLLYLQKGVRWIPSYKIDIDGKGHATVKLQATIINELADLQDAAVNLVVGVPTFAFKDTLDPISLSQVAAQLSQYFQNNAMANNGVFANNFSNAIMGQQARMTEIRPTAPAGLDQEPMTADGAQNEDLFVFHAGHITLKKGERMVLPLAEFPLAYQDVFTLELPFAPPPEAHRNLNNSQQLELARLLNAPKVMHKIRLTNKSPYPLTTAPALLLSGGIVLAQGMMTYTAIGATSDLTVTTAVDISAKKSDTESGRTHNAVVQDGENYTRVDLNGRITLVNHRAQPAELEITRHVLGNAESAEHSGKIDKINAFEDADDNIARPDWWNWFGWPRAWANFNGIGRITWKLKLNAGESVDLAYKWNYYWR